MIQIVKGFPVGGDGRVHGEFTHNPSSGRLSMHRPNLQNIPRGNDSEVQRWVKEIFVAPEGYVFWEIDYSAIEAQLVGYFCGSPDYIQFAKLGVHAYLASHLLGRPADLSWSKADLKAYFKELKATEQSTYDTAKRVVHLSNYRGTPHRMHLEYPETFRTTKEAAHLQGFYYELFPEIPKWHWDICERVDGTRRRRAEPGEEIEGPWELGVCYAINPFGYKHEFYSVFDWEHKELEDGERLWIRNLGDDAKRLISFFPQSTAAAIIKRAGKRVFVTYPDVGRSLRLFIHDSIVGECEEVRVDEQVALVKAEMEKPIPQLPLDPAWGLGDYLKIETEAKVGNVWANMKGR